jgi:hypothetical protein
MVMFVSVLKSPSPVGGQDLECLLLWALMGIRKCDGFDVVCHAARKDSGFDHAINMISESRSSEVVESAHSKDSR